MKIFRIVLYGFILVIIDIAGVACGAFLVYWQLGTPNLIALQLPLAVMLSLAFFYIWFRSLRALNLSRFMLGDNKERTACLVVSLLLAPLIFFPLHYFTQGYATGVGNFIAIAIYQLPVNTIALFGPWNTENQ